MAIRKAPYAIGTGAGTTDQPWVYVSAGYYVHPDDLAAYYAQSGSPTPISIPGQPAQPIKLPTISVMDEYEAAMAAPTAKIITGQPAIRLPSVMDPYEAAMAAAP
ncbi:hypothetical protein, partial [Candidatus Magnetobacterium casense]|uniref:hypothetical protein n=1 Tax=Candidatus Magnetobacterium casense TaxID=1455061 RepID=UPI001C43E755